MCKTSLILEPSFRDSIIGATRWSILYIANELSNEKAIFEKEKLFECLLKIKKRADEENIPYIFGNKTYAEIFKDYEEEGFLTPVNPTNKYKVAFNIRYFIPEEKEKMKEILSTYFNNTYQIDLFNIITTEINACKS
ncbi:MAG: hypothetical protein GF308_18080 [Candidatus Heimdallarchaeota archaeon]|nr:hypothetical protein [Candidatus Heimdallarchaeota archaeon]